MQMADLIYFVMVESLGLSCRSWISWAWTGATTDSVDSYIHGFHSIDHFFSRGYVDSLHLRGGLHNGWLLLQKSLKYMSKALFHLVTTSVISLCSGSCSSFCFCRSTWLAIMLRLKKLVMCLTLPSKHATDGSFSAHCEAKLMVCANIFYM